MNFIRTNVQTILAVSIITAVAAAPAIAAAIHADTVDGFSAVGFGASKARRAGKLVATSPSTGRLPVGAMNKAPDSSRLGGKFPSSYALTGHDHDGSYFTKSQLQTAGSFNDAGNPIDWTKLKNVPSGLDDGDDSAVYAAGSGLDLTDGTFSVAFGSITDGMLATNSVVGGPGGAVYDDTLTSDDLGQGSVTASELANGSVQGGTGGDIQDGSITQADISQAAALTVQGITATGNSTLFNLAVTNTAQFSNTVSFAGPISVNGNTTIGAVSGGTLNVLTSANIAGLVTGGGFKYGSSQTRTTIVDPTSCVRAGNGTAPYQDVEVFTSDANLAAPSLRISNNADGTYSYYCRVPIEVPAGATASIIEAALLSSDSSGTCLIGAELRSKTWGSSGVGDTVHSTVHNGSGAIDYGFTSSGLETKTFPFFAQIPLTPTKLVWVRGFQSNSGGGGDCRFGGATITYITDRPS